MLVAYDISDDGRRGRVAKELMKVGRRVQYSVFLVREQTPGRIAGLLAPVLALADDDVRIHPLCAACEAKAVLLGRAVSGLGGRAFRVI